MVSPLVPLFPLSWKVKVLATQWCLALCDPMDCSSVDSSVHGILQARILEWVSMPSSRRSSPPRNRTWVSCTPGRFFTVRDIIYRKWCLIVPITGDQFDRLKWWQPALCMANLCFFLSDPKGWWGHSGALVPQELFHLMVLAFTEDACLKQ